jgi:3-oxoacyl-[acyl-carrier-protein] synthase-3
VIDCIAEYGNTSAASIPIALAEAAAQGRLEPGSRVLLSAFGAGLAWGAGIVDWEGVG